MAFLLYTPIVYFAILKKEEDAVENNETFEEYE